MTSAFAFAFGLAGFACGLVAFRLLQERSFEQAALLGVPSLAFVYAAVDYLTTVM